MSKFHRENLARHRTIMSYPFGEHSMNSASISSYIFLADIFPENKPRINDGGSKQVVACPVGVITVLNDKAGNNTKVRLLISEVVLNTIVDKNSAHFFYNSRQHGARRTINLDYQLNSRKAYRRITLSLRLQSTMCCKERLGIWISVRVLGYEGWVNTREGMDRRMFLRCCTRVFPVWGDDNRTS